MGNVRWEAPGALPNGAPHCACKPSAPRCTSHLRNAWSGRKTPGTRRLGLHKKVGTRMLKEAARGPRTRAPRTPHGRKRIWCLTCLNYEAREAVPGTWGLQKRGTRSTPLVLGGNGCTVHVHNQQCVPHFY